MAKIRQSTVGKTKVIGYEGKRYKYHLWAVLASALPPSICVLVGVAALPRWVRTISVVPLALTGNHPLTGEDFWFLVLAWTPFLAAGMLSTLYTEVIVTAKGMKVRVLIFKWVFIPWEDVLDITVTPIPGGNAPSLWRFIRVRRLTYFHRLASMTYHTGPQPVLIINKYLEGYEELVQIIEEHVERAQIGDGATTADEMERNL